MQFAYQQTT